MKRIVVAATAAAFLILGALRAQAPVPKPGPEHRKLSIWLGEWTYEGELQPTPLGPAGKYTGKTTARSTLGGFFVEWRGEETNAAGRFQWHEIDGYDAANKQYFWKFFYGDGSVTSVTYTIDGVNVKYAGNVLVGDKQYPIRGTAVFAPDFMSNVQTQEIAVDGKTWKPCSVFRNTKTPPGAKKK